MKNKYLNIQIWKTKIFEHQNPYLFRALINHIITYTFICLNSPLTAGSRIQDTITIDDACIAASPLKQYKYVLFITHIWILRLEKLTLWLSIIQLYIVNSKFGQIDIIVLVCYKEVIVLHKATLQRPHWRSNFSYKLIQCHMDLIVSFSKSISIL
jgi:hypothetical protein